MNTILIKNTMTPVFFIIYCLTSAILLHVNLANFLSSNIGEISDGEDTREPFTNNSLVIVLAHQPANERDEEDIKGLQSQDLTEEISKVVDVAEKDPIVGVNTTKERLIQRRQNDHQNKLNAILDHMCEYYQSTIYFKYETHRIAARGVVEDDLRKMAEDLDRNTDIKPEVIQCASEVIKLPRPFFWKLPNDLRIETVMDHINDGVWNK